MLNNQIEEFKAFCRNYELLLIENSISQEWLNVGRHVICRWKALYHSYNILKAQLNSLKTLGARPGFSRYFVKKFNWK